MYEDKRLNLVLESNAIFPSAKEHEGESVNPIKSQGKASMDCNETGISPKVLNCGLGK